uniref:Uncharacterized protein n=1 Tax=Rhizophagus irregularis (strain DAOM 181602 / DAOM 197198 / MUCL 43194) TaxID=747089 RepID=U9SP11_RHIID
MFPNKFPNKLPFNSKKLNKEEITDFNQQMIVESEWFIDRLGMCVRSVNCEKKTYGQPCSPCSHIYFNSTFLNRLHCVVPDPKNTKFTPKFYYENNPLLIYLKNGHIKQLNEFLNTEDSSVGFWMELANKAVQGAFDQKPVFKGLCYIMLQAAERKEQEKGLRNLKYPTEFLNFLIVLGSISLKALDLFCQNLAGIIEVFLKTLLTIPTFVMRMLLNLKGS